VAITGLLSEMDVGAARAVEARICAGAAKVVAKAMRAGTVIGKIMIVAGVLECVTSYA
jgi:hypothetical protein